MPFFACWPLPVKSNIKRSPCFLSGSMIFQVLVAMDTLLSLHAPSGISAMLLRKIDSE